MCGIGGILRRGPGTAASEEATRLLQALAHRGPDGQGIYASPDGRALLLHARLAILGPGPAGRQPMTRAGCTITFNGEIYNFRALRDELRRTGEKFASETDTEVVLALYEQHGPDCLKHLRGMFAFAIWDERESSCFLARDRFGIKPLYYGITPRGDLIFASEVRAVMSTGMIESRLDPGGLESFLAVGSVAEPLTMFEGVRSLEAGHWMSWKNGQCQARRYFQIDFQAEEAAAGQAQDRTHAALLDSVRHHFVSDVPVGIFLSGGLDSGALAALAIEGGQGRFATFSIGVENLPQDESDAARYRAKFFGTDHREMLLTQELAGRWVNPFLEALDQPTVDGFNTYCVSKLAADHGYRVVLSGLGGDELFGGYPSFSWVPALVRAGQAIGLLRNLVGPLARIWETRATSARTARIAAYLQGSATVSRAYEAVRSIFSPAERARIGAAVVGERSRPEPTSAMDDAKIAGDWADQVSYLELTCYLRNQLLRDADVMSMAHGLELRVPFVDHELLGVLRTIPSGIRLAPRKQLLRASAPGIPHPDGRKPKRGFTLPFGAWLDTTWSELKDELRGAPPVPLDSWSRQWCLIVLSRWLRRHHFESWSK